MSWVSGTTHPTKIPRMIARCKLLVEGLKRLRAHGVFPRNVQKLIHPLEQTRGSINTSENTTQTPDDVCNKASPSKVHLRTQRLNGS